MKNFNNDVLIDVEAAKCWRTRFLEKRKAYGTQEEFAAAMRERGFKTTSTTVGRWENVGSYYGTQMQGFPKYSTMLAIADLLGVQVGYLVGETDGESFDAAKAAEYLGLDLKTVKSLRSLALSKGYSWDTFADKYGIEHVDFAVTLGKLITSVGFRRLVALLNELDCIFDEFMSAHSAENRESVLRQRDKYECEQIDISIESNPGRFSENGLPIDGDGMLKNDPLSLERIAETISCLKDKSRLCKCSIVDETFAVIREIWPIVAQLEEGVVDLGYAIVRIGDEGISVCMKDRSV